MTFVKRLNLFTDHQIQRAKDLHVTETAAIFEMQQKNLAISPVSLFLKLQAADEHRLQLVDVVTGFYGDAEPAWRH